MFYKQNTFLNVCINVTHTFLVFLSKLDDVYKYCFLSLRRVDLTTTYVRWLRKLHEKGWYDLLPTELFIQCLNNNQRQTQLVRSFPAAGFRHPIKAHVEKYIHL